MPSMTSLLTDSNGVEQPSRISPLSLLRLPTSTFYPLLAKVAEVHDSEVGVLRSRIEKLCQRLGAENHGSVSEAYVSKTAVVSTEVNPFGDKLVSLSPSTVLKESREADHVDQEKHSERLLSESVTRAKNRGKSPKDMVDSTPTMYFELKPEWIQDCRGSTTTQDTGKDTGTSGATTVGLHIRSSNSYDPGGAAGYDPRLPPGPSSSSLELTVNSLCFILHPASWRRAIWDGLGLMMITYDVFAIPFQVFDPPNTLFLQIMTWITQLFWNADIVASFFTGYFYKTGRVEMRWTYIAQHYSRTWLLFDVIIVGIDWVFYVLLDNGQSSTASATKLGKMSRVFRFARSLRLVKLVKFGKAQDFLEEALDVFASESVYTQLSIIKILFSIIIINHFIACVWYGIGNASNSGWVPHQTVHLRDLGYRYMIAYHWSISQFGAGDVGIHAQTGLEHMFSIIVLLMGLVLFSCLVSSATNTLARYQQQRSDEIRQFGLLRRFCRQARIPRFVTKRATSYLEHDARQGQRIIEISEVLLLNRLSEPLQAEVMYFKHLPFLQTNPLLGKMCILSPGVMRKVSCEALKNFALASSDVLVSVGQQANKVYHIIAGDIEYLRLPIGRERVQASHWIGEPALWTQWLYMGDLMAQTLCSMMSIDVNKFCEVVSTHPDTWKGVQRYAQCFVDYLNGQDPEDLSDLRTGPMFDFEGWSNGRRSSRRSTSIITSMCFERCLKCLFRK